MAAQIFSGSQAVDTSGVAETTLKEMTITVKTKISGIWIDANDSDTALTVKVYAKIDAANYRQIADYDYTIAAGDSVNVLAVSGVVEFDQDFKITLTPPGTGAGAKTIYYRIPYDNSVDKLQSVFNGTGDTDDVDIVMRRFVVNNDQANVAFDVQSSDGHAVNFESTGGNSAGARIRGSGIGNGIDCQAGATGVGALINGGATSGQGIFAQAQAGGGYEGIYAQGSAAGGEGFRCVGRANGGGFRADGNGTGPGMDINAGATAAAIDASAAGGIGAKIVGTTGATIEGTASKGMVIDSADGAVLELVANGNGDGLRVDLAAVGDGMDLNTTDGHGINTENVAGANKYELNIANAELAGVPAAGANVTDKLEWLFMALRNKTTQTASLSSIFNDAGASIGTAAIAKTTTTLSRAKYA